MSAIYLQLRKLFPRTMEPFARAMDYPLWLYFVERIVPLADKQWSEGCYVERDKLGFYVVVSSTRQAINLLSRYWPVSEGDAYFDALRVFGQVMIDKLPPDRARQAFLAAAEEADVFVSDVPRLLNMPRE